MKIPIRIVIADDHALFSGGLKSLVRRQRYMQVVGEADTAAAVMATVAETRCDILLLDLQMERWAVGNIQQLAAVTQVIVLTASESVENAVAAMRLGARAVVQKRFAVQINDIFDKLGLRDRVELAVYASRHGLVSAREHGPDSADRPYCFRDFGVLLIAYRRVSER